MNLKLEIQKIKESMKSSGKFQEPKPDFSNWSDEDLKSLTKVKNHKFVFDGYEYTWYRKLKDDWEIHFIRNFTDRKKAFYKWSFIRTNFI